uniref:Dynein regulatory complex subunit 4 n=1 Tax=Astyanax mexicanus TaxID=7994 RepID=A0A8B9J5I3_ASTMX
MEEAEERHQVEIKVYKQKVKHLLYEQQNSIAELKTEGVVTTKLLQKEHADLENDLRKGIRNLKVDIKEQELSSENLIKSLKLKHDEEITKIRNDFERQVREIEAKYEKKMLALRQEQDLRRKTEIEEIEERKNCHINTLIQNHEKAFSDIKTYYNDITSNNLALISTLKVCLGAEWSSGLKRCHYERRSQVRTPAHAALPSSCRRQREKNWPCSLWVGRWRSLPTSLLG